MTGVLGVILAFAIPWWMRAPIKPAWQLRSQVPLLMAGRNAPFVTLANREGVVTKFPVLTVLRFGNRGKGELKTDAYDGPVRVRFSKSRIVGAAIHDPLSIQTSTVLEFDEKALTFKPFLLRKDEWFEVQVVTDGPLEVPDLKVRMAGHKPELAEIGRKRYEFWRLTEFVSGAMVVTVFITGALAGPQAINGVNIAAFWTALVVLAIANSMKWKLPTWKNEPKAYSLLQ